MTEPERLALFVDSANMDHAAKRVGFYIDWKKAVEHFARGKRLYTAFFYIGVEGPLGQLKSEKQRFLDFLSYNGWTIRTKHFKTLYDGATGEEYQKANLDIEVVLDMVNTADNFDTAILFSGDGDFERAVELLRSKGKKVYVVATRGMIARELAYVADKPIFWLEELAPFIAREDRVPAVAAARGEFEFERVRPER